MNVHVAIAWGLAVAACIAATAICAVIATPLLVGAPVVAVATGFAWILGRITDPDWPATAEERELDRRADWTPEQIARDLSPHAAWMHGEAPTPLDRVLPTVERRDDVLAVWRRHRARRDRTGLHRKVEAKR